MRTIFSLLILISLLAFVTSKPSQKEKDVVHMNAGFVTGNLPATKKFYTENLHFIVKFESDWFLLLESPGGRSQLSFLQPGHPSQQPVFQKPFTGQGAYLTLETEEVDKVYKAIKEKHIPIEVELRDEPWGDRHFAIIDPNGIGIDIVTYSAPE